MTIGKYEGIDHYGDFYCDFDTEQQAIDFWNNRTKSFERNEKLNKLL